MKCYFKESNIYYAYDEYQGAFIAKSERFLIENDYMKLCDLEPKFETMKFTSQDKITFIGVKYTFELLDTGLYVNTNSIFELNDEYFSTIPHNEEFLRKFLFDVASYLGIEKEIKNISEEKAINFLFDNFNTSP